MYYRYDDPENERINPIYSELCFQSTRGKLQDLELGLAELDKAPICYG